MALNSTKLLEQITLKGSLPQGRFTDAELLDIAYNVLISEIQPLIVNLKEEYYLERKRYSITANQSSYLIPDRALGQKLREVKIICGNSVLDLPQMSLEDESTTQTGNPRAFYLENSYVKLYPTPSQTANSLEMNYFLRCSKPVTASEVGIITAYDLNTGVITASCPSTWTTSDTFDLTSKSNSGRNLARDLTASSVSTTQITLAVNDIPDDLTTGDYISLSKESFIIPVLDEAISLLVMLTVVECLQALGSINEMQLAQTKADSLRNQLILLLKSRVIGAPKRFSPMV